MVKCPHLPSYNCPLWLKIPMGTRKNPAGADSNLEAQCIDQKCVETDLWPWSRLGWLCQTKLPYEFNQLDFSLGTFMQIMYSVWEAWEKLTKCVIFPQYTPASLKSLAPSGHTVMSTTKQIPSMHLIFLKDQVFVCDTVYQIAFFMTCRIDFIAYFKPLNGLLHLQASTIPYQWPTNGYSLRTC